MSKFVIQSFIVGKFANIRYICDLYLEKNCYYTISYNIVTKINVKQICKLYMLSKIKFSICRKKF